MATITILHVSDVHFGERDRLGNQPEICNRLREKVHEHSRQIGFGPDLCIFSGDLTFQGTKEEFKSGEDWLKSLVKPWPNCRLFVVPGNHEVVRPTGDEANAASEFLHGHDNTGLKQDNYNGKRAALRKGWGNLLTNFAEWHEGARINKERLPCLVSDWSAGLYGCRWNGSVNDISVRVIGLNTALLSCEDNEHDKLLADMRYCNDALLNVNPETTLSIVVAHHPWIARDSATGDTEYWFVEWNRKHTETRLLQQTGAHLYLHGHVHNAQAESFSNSLGQHLVVLGAGATYQDQKYPLRSAFYRIDCNNQEIRPTTFRYSRNTGFWEHDGPLSNPFRTILPRVGPRYFSPSGPNVDDFGYEIVAGLHEISKKLDALSKEGYDLIYRPNKRSEFAKALAEYEQTYSFYIDGSLSTKKDAISSNITALVRHAQRDVRDAAYSSNEHLAHLFSQIDQFTTCHEAVRSGYTKCMHVTDRGDPVYNDLYAKIKTTKGLCDNAITHGIAFNRNLVSLRTGALR